MKTLLKITLAAAASIAILAPASASLADGRNGGRGDAPAQRAPVEFNGETLAAPAYLATEEIVLPEFVCSEDERKELRERLDRLRAQADANLEMARTHFSRMGDRRRQAENQLRRLFEARDRGDATHADVTAMRKTLNDILGLQNDARDAVDHWRSVVDGMAARYRQLDQIEVRDCSGDNPLLVIKRGTDFPDASGVDIRLIPMKMPPAPPRAFCSQQEKDTFLDRLERKRTDALENRSQWQKRLDEINEPGSRNIGRDAEMQGARAEARQEERHWNKMVQIIDDMIRAVQAVPVIDCAGPRKAVRVPGGDGKALDDALKTDPARRTRQARQTSQAFGLDSGLPQTAGGFDGTEARYALRAGMEMAERSRRPETVPMGGETEASPQLQPQNEPEQFVPNQAPVEVFPATHAEPPCPELEALNAAMEPH